MTPEQISTLIKFAFILAIVLIIALIWFIIWTAIWIPIRKKDAHLKELDAARIELVEIQAAKASEWDKYKDVSEEADRMRKTNFQTKADNEKLKEEIAKLKVDRDNLINYNRELKKQQQDQKETKAK